MYCTIKKLTKEIIQFKRGDLNPRKPEPLQVQLIAVGHDLEWGKPGSLSSLFLIIYSSEPGSPRCYLHQVHQVLHQVPVTELCLLELAAGFYAFSPLNLLQNDD